MILFVDCFYPEKDGESFDGFPDACHEDLDRTNANDCFQSQESEEANTRTVAVEILRKKFQFVEYAAERGQNHQTRKIHAAVQQQNVNENGNDNRFWLHLENLRKRRIQEKFWKD